MSKTARKWRNSVDTWTNRLIARPKAARVQLKIWEVLSAYLALFFLQKTEARILTQRALFWWNHRLLFASVSGWSEAE